MAPKCKSKCDFQRRRNIHPDSLSEMYALIINGLVVFQAEANLFIFNNLSICDWFSLKTSKKSLGNKISCCRQLLTLILFRLSYTVERNQQKSYFATIPPDAGGSKKRRNDTWSRDEVKKFAHLGGFTTMCGRLFFGFNMWITFFISRWKFEIFFFLLLMLAWAFGWLATTRNVFQVITDQHRKHSSVVVA